MIRNYIELVNEINKRTELAVLDTVKTMKDKLTECIDVYFYQTYEPTSYIRTDAFKESACYEILGNSLASVGISDDYMRHKYKARYTSTSADANLANIGQSYVGNWTGEDNAYAAEYGMHGNVNIYTGEHFWSEFISWCDSNVKILLKKNLIKYGVPIK